mgnify:CR=1 FL=1
MSKSKIIIKKYKLFDNANINYYKNIISKDESEKLYKFLKLTVPWEQGVYNMFGKPVKTPRMLYAFRDKGIDITDVYKVTGSIRWPKEITKLKETVEKLTGKTFRYAQVNYYRNGKDYIGYHTDSEVKKGDIIASVSLGVDRPFLFRHKEYKTNDVEKRKIILEDASLLVMDEHAAKRYWKHSLPKSLKITRGRINITFRPN